MSLIIKKNKNGFAMLNSMIVFIFIVTVAFIITAYVSTNSRQIYMQDVNIQSRFLAMSGIELGVDALLREQPGPVKLVESFKNGSRNASRIKSNALQDKIVLDGMGEVNVYIYRGGEVGQDNVMGDYVWVAAVGRCIKNNKVEATTTAKVQINLDYPSKASMEIKFGDNY